MKINILFVVLLFLLGGEFSEAAVNMQAAGAYSSMRSSRESREGAGLCCEAVTKGFFGLGLAAGNIVPIAKGETQNPAVFDLMWVFASGVFWSGVLAHGVYGERGDCNPRRAAVRMLQLSTLLVAVGVDALAVTQIGNPKAEITSSLIFGLIHIALACSYPYFSDKLNRSNAVTLGDSKQ